MDKYCGFLICKFNSKYKEDFPSCSDPRCDRPEGLCECGKNPVKVFEELCKKI